MSPLPPPFQDSDLGLQHPLGYLQQGHKDCEHLKCVFRHPVEGSGVPVPQGTVPAPGGGVRASPRLQTLRPQTGRLGAASVKNLHRLFLKSNVKASLKKRRMFTISKKSFLRAVRSFPSLRRGPGTRARPGARASFRPRARSPHRGFAFRPRAETTMRGPRGPAAL